MNLKSLLIRTVLYFFGERIFAGMFRQCETSIVYRLFCEKVYGRNLYQANMVAEDQLQKLLSIADLKPRQKGLDLGCGLGGTTEYITDVTGALFTGIDFARAAVISADLRTESKQDRIRFRYGDLNDLSALERDFECVISIDTLYFVRDLDKVIRQIKERLGAGGQFLVFYSCKHKVGEDHSPFKNKLGVALAKNGFTFETWDFTESERLIWEKTIRVAEELKAQFKEEGTIGIPNGRIAEAKRNLKWQQEGIMSRHLYRATCESHLAPPRTPTSDTTVTDTPFH